MNLIDKFKDPSLLDTLSTSDKIIGSLTVALLGITVTFVVLVLLLFIIKIVFKPSKEEVKETKIIDEPVVESNNDEELVAVIMAAIQATNTTNNKLVIRNIRQVSNSWKQTGIIEQIGMD